MKIVNLIENTPGAADCLYEHGLSFYIETGAHKFLADAGASDAFLRNAEILGIDLAQVDMLILSHGHYDHSGGILKFTAQNPKARILMQRRAGGEFYHKNDSMEKYIGIDPGILQLSQVQLLDGDSVIAENVFIFSGITGRYLWPSGNQELKEKVGDAFVQDEFLHEQYLVIREGELHVLISGCAHNGVLNILERYRELFGQEPDVMISGFHMQKKSGYQEEDLEMVRQTAEELKKTKTVFYTGHCTGEVPWKILREMMGDQVRYAHSGDEIVLG